MPITTCEISFRIGDASASWASEQGLHESDRGFHLSRKIGEGINLRSKVSDRCVQHLFSSVQRSASAAISYRQS